MGDMPSTELCFQASLDVIITIFEFYYIKIFILCAFVSCVLWLAWRGGRGQLVGVLSIYHVDPRNKLRLSRLAAGIFTC